MRVALISSGLDGQVTFFISAYDRVHELPDLRELAGLADRRLLDGVHAYFDSLCAL